MSPYSQNTPLQAEPTSPGRTTAAHFAWIVSGCLLWLALAWVNLDRLTPWWVSAGLTACGVGFVAVGLMAQWRRQQVLGAQWATTKQTLQQALAQAQGVAQQQRAQLLATLQCMSDAVIIIDTQGHVLHVNSACARQFRFKDNEEIPATIDQFRAVVASETVSGQAMPFGEGLLSRALGGETGTQVEGRLRRRSSGDTWTMLASYGPIRDAQGGVIGAVIVSRDITEHRRAEATETQSRAMLNTAFASMKEGVFITDQHGHPLEVNEAFIGMHLFETPEASRLPWTVHLADIETKDLSGRPIVGNDWPIARALRGEHGTDLVMSIRRKNSKKTPVVISYNYAPLRDPSGALIGGVLTAREVTADLAMRQELEESRKKLRRLVAKQNVSAEVERKRIARELHDELQQQLGAIRLDVGEMARQAGDPAAVAALAELTCGIVDQALDATRRIVNDLRPQILDDLGLPAALSAMAGQFQRSTHIQCDFELAGPDDTNGLLSAEVSTCLFRVAQESLNNVRKHAQASFVYLLLDLADPTQAHLKVMDDGVGVAPRVRRSDKTFGLLGMEERLWALGGSLEVNPGSRGGTSVDARVPLFGPARHDEGLRLGPGGHAAEGFRG